ncbi:WD repeat-containing protein 82-like [Diaphorina citri]|uniref:WD repeat-containing protein 82-like n=1 Tax=Diaphorina citri TaxID=121845 RepID=A0A1S3CV32_DIACI|nr:WD repeat-containing protein 82-like [Diaphorina citri]KAI5700094.1 hypothetical protein M8J75_014174 [Diaphorina citri]KAI5726694.1 hypothetical protein M8J76_006901 [Diaphorina citri]KAI5732337.1 hypothetical protein M8J77_025199 [Diaphorina citri]
MAASLAHSRSSRTITKCSENLVRSYRVAKVFRENTDKINSLDYSSDGSLLISCSDDDQIIIYDCEQGTSKNTINSKKYGVDLIKFTHSKTTAIHASTKVDATLRYLSLHDNKYVRYFPGHVRKVSSLNLSPVDDSFISGSYDKTVRVWDLRQPNNVGMIQLSGNKPIAAYDPEGLAFAIGVNSDSIKLYDVRSYDKGPFASFKCPGERGCEWTGLKFSPDGKLILVSTNGSIIRLFDAFNGNCVQSLSGVLNNNASPLEATFTPDSQFVASGSTDGQVHIWNAERGYKVCVLDGDHPSAVQSLQFNPKYHMLASACSNMAFWIPTLSAD